MSSSAPPRRPALQGHLKSGVLRAIGVMGKQRVASLPLEELSH